MLRVIRAGLEEWLAAGDRELSLLVATGTHRVASPEELAHIFGEAFLAAHSERIFSHDAKDQAQLFHQGARPPAESTCM